MIKKLLEVTDTEASLLYECLWIFDEVKRPPSQHTNTSQQQLLLQEQRFSGILLKV
jgi:hypothetical protein